MRKAGPGPSASTESSSPSARSETETTRPARRGRRLPGSVDVRSPGIGTSLEKGLEERPAVLVRDDALREAPGRERLGSGRTFAAQAPSGSSSLTATASTPAARRKRSGSARPSEERS